MGKKSQGGNLDIFENVTTLLEGEEMKKEMMELVQAHLSYLKEEFKLYFPDLSELDLALIRNPFLVDGCLIPNNVQEDLIEFLNDFTVRDAFETLPLMKFWSRMSLHFSSVAAMAVRGLLMFPSTYLWEQGFSALLNIKNKYRARLCIEPDLRVVLSKPNQGLMNL
ncbi:Protein ZBED8-like [Oopsacas minuta]|uniref:Protein ZBED8-like n=1 Tax=Oopsacas minuta TaxID=111878 RepID=A0AAV7JZN0_9METZ|nr:Protein ZBED8-like [Oopsacas minuta]